MWKFSVNNDNAFVFSPFLYRFYLVIAFNLIVEGKVHFYSYLMNIYFILKSKIF